MKLTIAELLKSKKVAASTPRSSRHHHSGDRSRILMRPNRRRRAMPSAPFGALIPFTSPPLPAVAARLRLNQRPRFPPRRAATPRKTGHANLPATPATATPKPATPAPATPKLRRRLRPSLQPPQFPRRPRPPRRSLPLAEAGRSGSGDPGSGHAEALPPLLEAGNAVPATPAAVHAEACPSPCAQRLRPRHSSHAAPATRAKFQRLPLPATPGPIYTTTTPAAPA